MSSEEAPDSETEETPDSEWHPPGSTIMSSETPDSELFAPQLRFFVAELARAGILGTPDVTCATTHSCSVKGVLRWSQGGGSVRDEMHAVCTPHHTLFFFYDPASMREVGVVRRISQRLAMTPHGPWIIAVAGGRNEEWDAMERDGIKLVKEGVSHLVHYPYTSVHPKLPSFIAQVQVALNAGKVGGEELRSVCHLQVQIAAWKRKFVEFLWDDGRWLDKAGFPDQIDPSINVTTKYVGPYEIRRRLGRGWFGLVVEATVRRGNGEALPEACAGQRYAIKIIDKENVTVALSIEAIQWECTLLSKMLRHPNIVQVCDIFHNATRVFIVMDYAGRYNMHTYLRQAQNMRLSTKDALTVMGQVSGAVWYCHERSVCHRDIKPGNITVLTDNPVWVVKIVDFGFAVESRGELWDACGTVPYMAPEVMYSAVTHRSYNGFCHDVWCVGILLLEMLSGLLCVLRALGWRKVPSALNTGHADEIIAYFSESRAPAHILSATCGEDAAGLLTILKGMLMVDMNLRWGMQRVVNAPQLAEYVVRGYDEDAYAYQAPKLVRRRRPLRREAG